MAKSTLSALVPLIITVILLAVAGAVGYVAYCIAMDVADKTNKKMENKHMSLSKDGMKVGVKEVTAEQVGDSTQRVLMKTLATQDRPAFQLRTSLSGHSVPTSPAGTPTPGTEKKRPFASSRGSSTSFSKSK